MDTFIINQHCEESYEFISNPLAMMTNEEFISFMEEYNKYIDDIRETQDNQAIEVV